ncbi:transposase [Methylobacterium planeticum]|uniref:Transposase n=1 Tax=Methylobacterium planeticum TaxID=2615211 RepID=A0A6N6MWM5_9HYPH|nr:transposase [Methylobacterium planeticum]
MNRRAADAVRGRIDWKDLLALELPDPGFDASVLSEFRTRLVVGHAEALLFDTLLALCRDRGLLTRRGRQRTDATHVLGSVRSLNRLGCVLETLRAALNALAVVAPDWLRAHPHPDWVDRYTRRADDLHVPQAEAARLAFAEAVGHDGHALLTALTAPDALPGCTTCRPSPCCGASGCRTSSAPRSRGDHRAPAPPRYDGGQRRRACRLRCSWSPRPTIRTSTTPRSARRAGSGTRSTSPRPAMMTDRP